MNKLILVILILFSVTVNSQISNFRLQRISPVIDMGTMTAFPQVGQFDFYGQLRLQGRGIDMGAAEYQDPTQRTVTARGGENHRIIKGNSVKLIASGGSKYLWSNGETTRSITVSPENTTDYTVTVSEWDSISTDEITVIVEDGEPPPIAIANLGSDLTILSGNSVTITTRGTPTSTYLWNNGETTQSIIISPNITTRYSVTVYEIGTESTDGITIFVNNN